MNANETNELAASGYDTFLDTLIVDEFPTEWADTHQPDPLCHECDGLGLIARHQYGEEGVGTVWSPETCDCTMF